MGIGNGLSTISMHISKLSHYVQRAGVPNVSITAPPMSTAFANFHHNSLPISQFTNTRKDRQNTVPPVHAPIPPIAPQFIYLPAPPTTYHHARKHSRDTNTSLPDHYQSERQGHSPPLPAHAYPSVGDWLTSLETKVGAEKCDFPSMQAKFQSYEYLEMDLDNLSGIPRSEYSEGRIQIQYGRG
jgi:hypothetical protein